MKWVHKRYLGQTLWWEYTPRHDICWYWRKIYKVKEEFKWGSRPGANWLWKGTKNGGYTVQAGYKWYMEVKDKPKWARLTWSRGSIPRHSFVSWLIMRNRLPVRERLAKYTAIPTACQFCQSDAESIEHLFYNCIGVREVWQE